VSLGQDIDATLPFLRGQAESRMKETVTFSRVTGEVTTDPDTLEVVEVRETVATTVARIKYRTLNVQDRDQGTQLIALQSPEVHVPFGAAPTVRTDDRVQVTASDDPTLVGRLFRVTGRPQAGQTTAHRFPVEEIS